MDDDGIMLEIYDNIGDELKAKNKLLEKEKQKVKREMNENAERSKWTWSHRMSLKNWDLHAITIYI